MAIGPVLSVLAVALAVAGLRYRIVAIAAVVCLAAALTLSGHVDVWTYAAAGAAATLYLVLAHGGSRRSAGRDVLVPVAAALATLVTVLAFVVPIRLPWLGAVAPPAVLLLIALPLLAGGTDEDPRDP
ncbi:hypothetical protein ACFYTQ_35865 [Nocardia sp. NPDC004068]|uniref:hypothetical protein n=1 Tax=Nocardia sp. NPDC004068 TaxID=3364303 RepID=UPI0036B6DD39